MPTGPIAIGPVIQNLTQFPFDHIKNIGMQLLPDYLKRGDKLDHFIIFT